MLPSWLTLIFMLLLAGVLVCLLGILLIAISILRPPRMGDGKALAVLKRLSPADLGLGYEEMDFQVIDDRRGKPLRIAGWWIPSPHASTQTVILIHGYADAKVGAIAWGATWHQLGWNILAIDLRAHGESGGTQTMCGYYERHDVGQVINQLRILKPDQTGRLALFGESMGAAVAVATAAQRDDVDALVLDSPIADYAQTVLSHARLVGSPMFLMPPAIKLAEWISRANFGAVATTTLLPIVRCPIFAIMSGQDALISEHDRARISLFLKFAGPDVLHQVWRVENAEHLQALGCEPVQYAKSLKEWLDAIRVR